jgi:ABC-2 type transport system permease protein
MQWVWRTLYKDSEFAFGTSISQMITYATLTIVIMNTIGMRNGIHYYISERVKTGLIESDLYKPVDYIFHMFSINFGEVVFRFIAIFIPVYIAGYIFYGIKLPENIYDGILFVISVLLGYIVQFLLSFLIGLLSFVTLNIWSITWTYMAVFSFFSGQIVPLWLYPDVVKIAADLMPFKCVFYIPVSIYLGKYENYGVFYNMVSQLFWILILYILARIFWNIIHKRIVVQGG